MKTYRDRKRRVLGQHFLNSPGVLKKIVETVAPAADDLVVEIGPGKGALTYLLAERAGQVVAIEKDPAMLPFLQEKPVPNLTIIEGDVLDCDFAGLLAKYGRPYRRAVLAGNLPYSISTPLLFKLLEDRAGFARCVFLVQKEVAERICARPGSKAYAPLSILLQNRYAASIRFAVHAGSFSPPPRVESALVTLEARPEPSVRGAGELRFAKFLKSAFRQRRKTLWNNLAAAGRPASLLERIFPEAGLSPTIRPEQVEISGFVDLFALFERSTGKAGGPKGS
jgi:16S rRNA (adenine1518-N6/adenine1519-N6)-dimethyltransferase